MPEPYVFPLEMHRTVDLSKSPTPDALIRVAREWSEMDYWSTQYGKPRPRREKRRAANLEQTRRETCWSQQTDRGIRWDLLAMANTEPGQRPTVRGITLPKSVRRRTAKRQGERWHIKAGRRWWRLVPVIAQIAKDPIWDLEIREAAVTASTGWPTPRMLTDLRQGWVQIRNARTPEERARAIVEALLLPSIPF